MGNMMQNIIGQVFSVCRRLSDGHEHQLFVPDIFWQVYDIMSLSQCLHNSNGAIFFVYQKHITLLQTKGENYEPFYPFCLVQITFRVLTNNTTQPST